MYVCVSVCTSNLNDARQNEMGIRKQPETRIKNKENEEKEKQIRKKKQN